MKVCTVYVTLRPLKSSPVPLHLIGDFRVAVCLGFEVSLCSTIEREMSLTSIRIVNSFPFEWLSTRTRFETEACSNSEMTPLAQLVLHRAVMQEVAGWNPGRINSQDLLK